jgi:hypothetical protein
VVVLRDPLPVRKAPQPVEFLVPRPPLDDPDFFEMIPNVARLDY